jgi:hypothetical protein
MTWIMFRTIALAAALGCATSAAAQSVTDVVVMRRVMAAPQPRATPTPSPSVTCATPVQKRYAPASNSTHYLPGAANTLAQAVALCVAKGATAGPGVCQWDSMDKRAQYIPNVTYIADYPDAYLSAALCTR